MAQNFNQAVYNEQTGVTLLAHPTLPDTYVSTAHFKDLMDGKVDEQKCVYTEERVCIEWTTIPGNPGQICTNTRTIKTCVCT